MEFGNGALNGVGSESTVGLLETCHTRMCVGNLQEGATACCFPQVISSRNPSFIALDIHRNRCFLQVILISLIDTQSVGFCSNVKKKKTISYISDTSCFPERLLSYLVVRTSREMGLTTLFHPHSNENFSSRSRRITAVASCHHSASVDPREASRNNSLGH